MITEKLFQDAILFANKNNGCSINELMAHFDIGINKASMLMDVLENEGIIYPYQGTGKIKRELIKYGK